MRKLVYGILRRSLPPAYRKDGRRSTSIVGQRSRRIQRQQQPATLASRKPEESGGLATVALRTSNVTFGKARRHRFSSQRFSFLFASLSSLRSFNF